MSKTRKMSKLEYRIRWPKRRIRRILANNVEYKARFTEIERTWLDNGGYGK